MTATSSSRGWPTVWIGGEDVSLDDKGWVFADQPERSIADEPQRRCRKCGQRPTPEGYDACIGYISGSTGACCGHGENFLENPEKPLDALRG